MKRDTKIYDIIICAAATFRGVPERQGRHLIDRKCQLASCVMRYGPHLSPDTSSVVEVVFVIGELPDAVVDSNTALPRRHVLLRHLHPAQGAHSETLQRHKQATGGREEGKRKNNPVRRGWRSSSVLTARGQPSSCLSCPFQCVSASLGTFASRSVQSGASFSSSSEWEQL